MTPADLSGNGPCPEAVDQVSSLGDMADFPQLRYSNNQVKKAGEALRGVLELNDQAIESFRIAYNWRDSHAWPMRRLRDELKGKVRRVGGQGITAARTKRMVSIRKKLRKSTNTLLQIQDLGGCRAILDSMEGVNRLIDLYRAEPAHEVCLDRSYIHEPKFGGYRSHHFVFKFKAPEGEEHFQGRRIEVQIRTRLQHAWATAVEAVGLVRGEDLKAGEGDRDWLRLFDLMSSEFAQAEGCPTVPGAPEKPARVRELLELDKKLEAIATLENLNNALQHTSQSVSGARFFLIQYDNVKRTVKVRGYYNALAGAEHYSAAETGDGSVTTVLVEADKIEGLKDAYPNYFLDVRLFASNMARSLSGLPLDTLVRDEEPEAEPEPRQIASPPRTLSKFDSRYWSAWRRIRGEKINEESY
jgi:hypothetical protein